MMNPAAFGLKALDHFAFLLGQDFRLDRLDAKFLGHRLSGRAAVAGHDDDSDACLVQRADGFKG